MVHFGSVESLQKTLCRYVDDSIAEETTACINVNNKGETVINQEQGIFFIWMLSKPKTAEDIGFLAHKIFHAVAEMMRTIGVRFSEDSEEIYAYTVGYLMHQILESFGNRERLYRSPPYQTLSHLRRRASNPTIRAMRFML